MNKNNNDCNESNKQDINNNNEKNILQYKKLKNIKIAISVAKELEAHNIQNEWVIKNANMNNHKFTNLLPSDTEYFNNYCFITNHINIISFLDLFYKIYNNEYVYDMNDTFLLSDYHYKKDPDLNNNFNCILTFEDKENNKYEWILIYNADNTYSFITDEMQRYINKYNL